MANVKIHSDIILKNATLTGAQFLDFPTNPRIGTEVLVEGIKYIWSNINGVTTWYPLTNRYQNFVHTQGVDALEWNIIHNFDTMNIIFFVYNHIGELQFAQHDFVSNNEIKIIFTEATRGRCVVFAASELFSPSLSATNITINDTINVGSNILPTTNGVANIGSPTNRFASIYANDMFLSTNTLWVGDTPFMGTINGSIGLKSSVGENLHLQTQGVNDEVLIKSPFKVDIDTPVVNITGNKITLNNYQIVVDEITQDLKVGANLETLASKEWIDNQNYAVDTHTHTFASLTTKPTTLNGYGITDAINISQKGVENGIATLGSDGLVLSTQLPSYIDDVLEYAALASFPAIGEIGKIYVAIDTNKTYRWSGSVYVYITSGAVDSVAGKTGIVTLVKGDVGLSNVDNTTDENKNVLSATKLTTARNIAVDGDATGSVAFDGSGDVSITTTLSNTAVIAGSYGSATQIPAITIDSKGRITSASNTAVSIPSGSLTFTGDVTGTGNTGSSTTLTIANKGVANGIATLGSDGKVPSAQIPAPSSYANMTNTVYIATAGQTVFNTVYTVGFVDVFHNGLKLADVDYSATNGTSITLNVAASVGDSIDVISYGTLLLADTYTQAQIDAAVATKQATLVSGTNIKTVNGTSVLGSGDITISGGATVTNDIATNSDIYPVFTSLTSGSMTVANIATTKLKFNPSTGNFSSTVFTSLSDINKKKDITNIVNGKDVINSLTPVDFVWKDTNEKSSGVIAQQLEEILPHLVVSMDNGDKTVNYMGIIGYLIGAVQDLSKEVEVLKQK